MFNYYLTKEDKRDTGESSLFSLEWLSKIFGKADDESLEDKMKKLQGDISAKMKMRNVSVSG